MFLKSIYIALLFFYLLPTNSFSLLIASEKTAYPTSTYRSNKKYNESLNKLLEEIIKKNYELTSGYQNFPADFKKIYSNSERGLKLILDNKNYLIPLHLELETKLQLAVFGSILGNHSSAESYFWEILRRAKDVYEENDTFILDTLSSLGIHYLQSGEYKKAKEAFETLLAIQEKYLGAENPITIITRNYLFKTYRINGPLQKAQEKFDENKKLLKKVKDNKYIEKYLNNSKRFNKPIKDFYYKYAIFHLNHLFKFYQVQQLFNAGLLDIFDNDYKKAEKNFVEAEKLIIKSENFDSVSTNLYRYLGLINTALRN